AGAVPRFLAKVSNAQTGCFLIREASRWPLRVGAGLRVGQVRLRHCLMRPEFCADSQAHFFFSSAVQFCTRLSGADDSSLTAESTMNRLPSPVTSYWPNPAGVRYIVRSLSNSGRIEATCREPPACLSSTAINILSGAR